MAFQFSLAAVLKYREGLEHREFLALEKLQNDVSLAELRVKQVEEQYLAAEKNRTAELAAGVVAADLRSAYEYRASLDRQRQILLNQLQTARTKWQQQLQKYQAARRSRETLDKLRSQKLEAFAREKSKREQNTLDDIFLARRARRD